MPSKKEENLKEELVEQTGKENKTEKLKEKIKKVNEKEHKNDEETEETTVSVTSNTVKVSIGSTDVEINGSTESMDVAPYIQSSSNSTMVPLRFVALAVSGGNIDGADSTNAVQWDAVSKTVTINANNNVITFTAGSNVMTVNGVRQTMDNGAAAEIKDSRMFIPFRALGNALGVNVDWDADTKTAVYK